MADDAFVTAMPNCFVNQDGTSAEMNFILSDGTSKQLVFSPVTMMNFVNRVFELFVNQKIQTASKTGHFEVQPLPVVVTAADSAVGGKAVIVHLKLGTGLPSAFAIPPMEAEELERQLGKAIKKAKKHSGSARH